MMTGFDRPDKWLRPNNVPQLNTECGLVDGLIFYYVPVGLSRVIPVGTSLAPKDFSIYNHPCAYTNLHAAYDAQVIPYPSVTTRGPIAGSGPVLMNNSQWGNGGARGYIVADDHPVFDWGDGFTYEFRGQVDSTFANQNSGSNVMICRRNTTNSDQAGCLWREWSTRRLLFTSNTYGQRKWWTYELLADVLYHIVAVARPGDGVYAYVNGAQVPGAGTYYTTVASDEPLTIAGVLAAGGTDYDGWPGYIYHAAVWDRPLTDEEIEMRFQNPDGMLWYGPKISPFLDLGALTADPDPDPDPSPAPAAAAGRRGRYTGVTTITQSL